MKAAFLLVAVLAAPLSAEEIPLKKIWAYNIPGTRDVSGQEAAEEVQCALTAKPPSELASSGFVVLRPMDLRTVTNRIAHPEMWQTDTTPTYPYNEELTLVFFSHPAAYEVRLKQVERQGNTITVRYEFEPRETNKSTFALIPLGKLPAGEYRVQYEQTPRRVDDRLLVSRPFSFKVVADDSDSAPDPGAIIIPLKKIWAVDMPGTQNIRELEPRTEGDNRGLGPLALSIYRKLREDTRGWGSDEAGPGFVVPGKGIAALNAAYDVLIIQGYREKRPTVVPAGEVSIIFFARYSGLPCRLEKVVRNENVVTLEYRFTAANYGGDAMSAHFALIPLGKLNAGKYEVRIKQLKLALRSPAGVRYTAPLKDERVRPVVSQPFSFEVK